MYQQHFNFSFLPFTITPDPSVLYLSQEHGEALRTLQHGLQREGGFLLLTGEVGTGKTTLTRLLIQSFVTNETIDEKVAYILNPRLSETDLLHSIADELELTLDSSMTVRQLIAVINEALLLAHSEGKTVILVIEEAQNLSPELLEMLRLLTNLETNTKKLLTILLVGQPELLDMINSQQLRQLKQRIIARHHLQPLSSDEVNRYIDYRLQLVEGHGNQINASARRTIYKWSNGIPRLINLLADSALMNAYKDNRPQVIAKDVNKAVSTLGLKDKKANDGKLKSVLLMSILIVLTLILAMLWVDYRPMLTAISTTSTKTNVDISSVTETSTSNLVAPAATVTPTILTTVKENSPLQQLVSLWGFELNSTMHWRQYCEQQPQQLQCFEKRQASIDDIKQINIPVLVTLVDKYSQANIAIVSGINEELVTLQIQQQQKQLTIEEFRQQWLQDFKALLPSVTGFTEVLRAKDRNKPLLNWLQQRLQEQGMIEEIMITGGVYNKILVDAVKRFQRSEGINADGDLGVITLMKLLPESQKEYVPWLQE